MTRQRPLFFDQIVESTRIIFDSRLTVDVGDSSESSGESVFPSLSHKLTDRLRAAIRLPSEKQQPSDYSADQKLEQSLDRSPE